MTRARTALGILGALTIAACGAPVEEVDPIGETSGALSGTCLDCEPPDPEPVPGPTPTPVIKYSAVFSSTGKPGSRVLLGRPESEFFSTTNSWAQAGYRIVDIDVVVSNGQRLFSGVFEPAAGAWSLYILGWNDFVAKNAQLQTQSGLKLVDVETYVSSGQRWFVGVWRPEGPARKLSASPSSWSTFNAQVQAEAQNGYLIKDVEVYVENGQERVVGLWEQKAGGYVQWASGWNAFSKTWLTQSAAGMRLTDMEAYVTASGQRSYVGFWQQGSGAYDLVAATTKTVLERKLNELAAKGKYPTEIEMEFGTDQAPPGLAAEFHDLLDGKVQGYSYAIAEAGVVTAASGMGYARSPGESVSSGLPMLASTRQDIASTTKTITATAMLNLLEANIPAADPRFATKLDAQLDRRIVDVLGTELAGVELGTGVGQVTLRHLLTHKSGFGAGQECTTDYKAKIRAAFQSDTLSTPGSGTAMYSNFNYCVLRWAIEKLSNQAYETYLEQQVFAPLDISLNCTPYSGIDRVLYYSGANLSMAGYLGDSAAHLDDVCGAGGLQSSADFSIKFLLGLRNDTMLRPQTSAKMRSEQLGIWAQPVVGGTAYLHNGGMGGNNAGRGNSTGWGLFPNDTQAVLYVNTRLTGLDAAQVLARGYERMRGY